MSVIVPRPERWHFWYRYLASCYREKPNLLSANSEHISAGICKNCRAVSVYFVTMEDQACHACREVGWVVTAVDLLKYY